MKLNKKTIIIILCFVLTIILTSIITTIIVKHYNKGEQEKTNEIFKENSSTQKEEEIIEVKDDTSEENNQGNDKEVEETKKEDTKKPITNTDATKSEEDIVKYVETVSNTSSKSTLKEGFVTVIDFLFYDEEIYGKTFKDLSNSAKIKIISLAIKIDAKIEEYIPGYKESISNSTKKVYTNIKTKLVTLYLDTTVKICNSNPTLCEDAKAGLKDLKENFGITWDFIKDITGVGFKKLKDWYEVWREE